MMNSVDMERRIVSWFVFVAAFITVCGAVTPKLEISPNVKTASKSVGSNLALTCRPVVDDVNLLSTVEWYDPKGRKIDENTRGGKFQINKIPGGVMLIINNINENLSGNYTCSANYANEKLSNSILVSTYVDIKFVDAPKSQSAVVGKDAKIKCKVEGSPAPNIDWNKNDVFIKSAGRYVIANDGLIIKNVNEADDGVYTCTAVVVETGQIDARDIKFEVQVPPKIEPLQEISIVEGETATTVCKATGKPPPTYKWIKEVTREDLSKTDRFSVKANTGELLITRVESNDDSVYKCIAQNGAGFTEASVKINVLVKPKIYELLNATEDIQKETQLICKTQGRPPPLVTFRKTSTKIPFKDGVQEFDRRIYVEQQHFPDKGETIATLKISNLNRSDDGLYECVAKNAAGAAYKNGHITVHFPPTFEKTKNYPPVWTWDNRPGNLSCVPEAIPNATISWRFGNFELTDNPNYQIIGHGPVSNLIVRPLSDRLFGKYECVAKNSLGAASKFIDLRKAEVPGIIPEVRPETITATTVKFSIIPPPHFDGLPLRSFTVQYREEREISWDFARNYTWSYGAPYILENLIPERTYQFRFAARNDVGLGPYRNIPSITMPRQSEPAEPKILAKFEDSNSSNRQDSLVLSPYADHYELNWRIPNDNGDPIDEYLIRYCVTEKINGEWRDSECSEEISQSAKYTTYELRALQPDTIYKIELRAHNTIGRSSPAQIRMKTARGVMPRRPVEEPRITSGMIIGIVVACIVLVIVIVDCACFCINRTGILAMVCDKTRTKNHDEEDPKLSRDGEREPLKPDSQNGHNEKPMTAEFDGRHVHTKPGEIIGKHSAV